MLQLFHLLKLVWGKWNINVWVILAVIKLGQNIIQHIAKRPKFIFFSCALVLV